MGEGTGDSWPQRGLRCAAPTWGMQGHSEEERWPLMCSIGVHIYLGISSLDFREG